MSQNIGSKSSSISKIYAVSNSIDEYLEKLKNKVLNDVYEIPILEVDINGIKVYKINSKYVECYSFSRDIEALGFSGSVVLQLQARNETINLTLSFPEIFDFPKDTFQHQCILNLGEHLGEHKNVEFIIRNCNISYNDKLKYITIDITGLVNSIKC
jgi:hypothetical protein